MFLSGGRTPETWLFKYSCTEDQCAFCGEVMSTELEVSVEKKKDIVFLKRVQLFFYPFCKSERKIISQYKGSIPYV